MVFLKIKKQASQQSQPPVFLFLFADASAGVVVTAKLIANRLAKPAIITTNVIRQSLAKSTIRHTLPFRTR